MSAEHRPPSDPAALPPVDPTGCRQPFALLHRPYAHEYGLGRRARRPGRRGRPAGRPARCPIPRAPRRREDAAGPGAVPAGRRAGLRRPRRRHPAAVRCGSNGRRCCRWPRCCGASQTARSRSTAAASTCPTTTYAGHRARGCSRDEIGRGRGRQLRHPAHLRRRHRPGTRSTAALALFRRLLSGERGAYWTFVVHTGDRTLVGASPERHVSVAGGHGRDEPDQRHLPLPGRRPTLAGVLRLPRRPPRRSTSCSWWSTRS